MSGFEMPAMTPVKSSNVAAVGHTGDSLVVQFHGKDGAPGPVWMYRGAPASYAGEIAKAASPGAMFHRLIRAARHPGEKVG